MSKRIVNSAEEYRLVIEDDLLALIREAIALQEAYRDSEEYSRRRAKLEDRLYDLYQEIGWSVVYDIKSLPF